MTSARTISEPAPQELHSGDRMSQPEFHRIYEQTPEDFKAELIGGIVYVASPLKRPHGTRHVGLSTVFGIYHGNTPGVEAGDNISVILGEEDEPQPDLYMRILPEFGGQSRDTSKEYIEGAPELLAEIAHSSYAIDMHDKRECYAESGVLEYIVVCLQPRRLHWFDLKTGRELAADAEGVFKSLVFPGLWIHGQGLLELDYQRLLAVLHLGLQTPEHQTFTERLAANRRQTST